MSEECLRYELEHVDEPGFIEKAWCQVEQVANVSFFLSWQWISCWMEVMKPDLHLCSVYTKDRLIGLGLFVSCDLKRHRFLSVKQLRLHSTGLEACDQIWPEYNGMLVESGYEALVYSGLVPFLESAPLEWDEFVIGPLDKGVIDIVNCSSTTPLTIWQAPTYRVNLRSLHAGKSSFLESISKNTRQQIRRSIRHYEKKGGLSFTKARSPKEARQYFDAIGILHKQRWNKESGFCNHRFIQFHHQLIEMNFHCGSIELLKLEVAGDVVGYLYNFVFRNKVLFYLSGLDCVVENKLKPGLVLHSLSIQTHLDNGDEEYDFLGGDARYKRSLALKSDNIEIVLYQKRIAKLILEQKLRRVKQTAQAFARITTGD